MGKAAGRLSQHWRLYAQNENAKDELRSLGLTKVNTLGQKCQSGPNEWNQLHAYGP